MRGLRKATTGYTMIYRPLIINGKNSVEQEGIDAVFKLAKYADDLEAGLVELYNLATGHNIDMVHPDDIAETVKRIKARIERDSKRIAELDKPRLVTVSRVFEDAMWETHAIYDQLWEVDCLEVRRSESGMGYQGRFSDDPEAWKEMSGQFMLRATLKGS